MMGQIADLRKEYVLGELNESAMPADPLDQFSFWFESALQAKIPEANAMTLATVDALGRPSTRIVLIKNFNCKGLSWFTNYQSRKAKDLQQNPYAALQFHWVEQERVVRIEGVVERLEEHESDAYFASRPLASCLGALASPQSAVLSSRQELEDLMTAVSQEHPQRPPRPTFWGGYLLRPHMWEFWQGRASRLHDRIRYLKASQEIQSSDWLIQRLAP